MSAKTLLTGLLKIGKKNLPTMFVILGVGGTGLAMVLTAKDTVKAKEELDKREEEKGEELTPREKIETVVPIYADSAVVFAASAVMIFSGHRMQLKRTAAAIASFKILDKANKNLWSSVQENTDAKTIEKIESTIAKKHIEEIPLQDDDDIINTGYGEHRCLDVMSKRYFFSDINKVEHAVNVLNKRLLVEGSLSLNEFYDELNLEHTRAGDLLGWNIESCQDLIKVRFSSQIDAKGRPCLVVDYTVEPGYDFRC